MIITVKHQKIYALPLLLFGENVCQVGEICLKISYSAWPTPLFQVAAAVKKERKGKQQQQSWIIIFIDRAKERGQ